MDMTETLTYGADPTTVFAMLCDQQWREQVCTALHALDTSVTIEKSGHRVTVTTRRTLAAQVPDAVRTFTGDRITLTQVEQWSAPHSDGSRTADLQVTVAGQPAGMKGDITLSATGSGSTEVVRGDVKVNVPFVGKKIEPQIVEVFRAAIVKEGELGRAHLATG